MKPLVLTTALVSLLVFSSGARATGEAQEGSTTMSAASRLVGEGSATVLYGSLSAMVGAGTVIVESVEAAGDASVVVLAGASQAARASLRLSGAAANAASLVAGASVNVVATSTGYLLVASGKVLAFIPNEIGKALIHHSRSSERG